MTPLAIALALFAQDAPAAAPAQAAPAAAAEERWPTGAPREDYQFVAWCYGALRGYLDMHDEVIPEVTRIEKQFRKPGTSLADDMKVYADMQKDGREKLKLFQSAITAAERASVRPINAAGAEAVKQGRAVWNAGPGVTKARKAQEWMSWALPARCETTAAALERRATLAAATLRGSDPAAPAAEAPPADAPQPDGPPAG
ncbi:hypothetical protein LRS10_11675 [Phenylobacterium sp. J426]|uniref:hypothetical protein n=1 Tax=Phenylobacterium sp. J426 TaxID=2898439 RepID=UPI00215114D3|nr:hypothetical protein [Phenylobacterium sp. J426]MCR5874768.1 hypothetical protein [Phenylobacterium sp. J426]